MKSSKEDETAMLDALFGTMSLGDSTERKDNDTAEPTAAKNGTTPTKLLCSACGEKSNSLKKCNGCLCVWYCDKKCQNKHRKEHKKECRVIKKILDERGGKLDLGTELEVGALGKLPPQEECPICMRVLPIHRNRSTYAVCCGKTFCCGCDFQHQMKNEDLAAEKGLTSVPLTCAFCREPVPGSDEDCLGYVRKRVELKDPEALRGLALKYGYGEVGLPLDQAKCIELLRESADVGCPASHNQLGTFHLRGMMGLEQNEEKAFKYFEKAAEGGHIVARHNLGCAIDANGDRLAAMRHWRLAASGGHKKSMGALIFCFEGGLYHHTDLAETAQAFYLARAEMSSKDRDEYIKYLKFIGTYRDDFDL